MSLNDLQPAVKDLMNHENNMERQNELIPNGMPNREAEVSKEYAVELINRVQVRQQLAYANKKGRDI